ncbi:NAD(+) synthase [Rhabdochromatium marinum]|uniref:NAD(+) synthase n=1 Tax=Rhabdochromatium marinum TaxID=48729 RepID=UPI001904DB88|nr:NAD(+) synthase [Rhabdochromatium marinum]MBK1648386.1 NAD(+) synthase [Rhabdochromatium marinum]
MRSKRSGHIPEQAPGPLPGHQDTPDFFNLYHQGLVRVAVCVPEVVVANPHANAAASLRLAEQAAAQGALVALFPELGLSAYTNEDLFQQQALLDASLTALEQIRTASRQLNTLLVVGVPLAVDHRLFNCAVAVHQGRLLGAVPKTYLPNYREFYEKRQFSPAAAALSQEIRLLGESVPFGNDLLFEALNLPGCVLHLELCEDLWTPIPPSTYAALAGATLLLNLSASNITIGKAAERHALCAAQSSQCMAAYLYSAAGPGESTTDLAWDGHAVIYENGQLLAESARFAPDEQLILSDVDLEQLIAERRRRGSFADAATAAGERLRALRRIGFTPEWPTGDLGLMRRVERFPFVPADSHTRDERCFEAYNIQVQALVKRLTATGIERIVIGVSGGLDSTQALLVAARAMDRLQRPRTNVLAYTLPGFATSAATRANAWALMQALGVTAQEIDIRPSCTQMLKDIGHPFAAGQPVHDVTFENVQAGERTSHLFRLANHQQALVLGTGDLSEIALGWSTYGVGDQMSHYNVNASVSKTLIQYLIRWLIDSSQFDAATNQVLQRILDTEISPELVPPDAQGGLQRTEDIIGPYALQDFNLYYISRYGLRPSKVAFLAWHAWHDRAREPWPDGIPADARHAYDLDTIQHWLEVFLTRFFGSSQFKRSCMPNGPKVGSGGSLSPRGDWRAPSDAVAHAWIDELHQNLPGVSPDGASAPPVGV